MLLRYIIRSMWILACEGVGVMVSCSLVGFVASSLARPQRQRARCGPVRHFLDLPTAPRPPRQVAGKRPKVGPTGVAGWHPLAGKRAERLMKPFLTERLRLGNSAARAFRAGSAVHSGRATFSTFPT